MAGEVHKHLVVLGEKWVKREGFAVVASELVTGGTREEADVIGFRSTCSVMIEAKASRADFLADARKPHRIAGGLGVYRFYLCPPGVIEIGDLPDRWGLLHAEGRKVIDVLRPKGNAWPAFGSKLGDWYAFQHEVDAMAERAVLFSIARRRSLSRADERYEKMIREATRRGDRLARENSALVERQKQLEIDLYLKIKGLSTDGQQAVGLKAAIRRKIA